MRKIIAKTGIAENDIDAGLRNHRVLMSHQAVAPLARNMKRAITMPDAMELLGTDRRDVEALVAVGALTYATGVQRDSFEHHRFRREDVEQVLQQLLADAIPVLKQTARRVDIPTARHMAGPRPWTSSS